MSGQPTTMTSAADSPAHARQQSTGSGGSDLEREVVDGDDGDSLRQSGDVPTKGDYRLLVEDPAEFSKHTLSAGGTGAAINQIVNSPALPVLSYCAASILMTVVNKVR
jgi:hypothetical protein